VHFSIVDSKIIGDAGPNIDNYSSQCSLICKRMTYFSHETDSWSFGILTWKECFFWTGHDWQTHLEFYHSGVNQNVVQENYLLSATLWDGESGTSIILQQP